MPVKSAVGIKTTAQAGGGGGPVVTVTTSSLPSGTTGVPYSAQLAATGGTAPYTFTVTGGPGWLTAAGGGALSGTPNATGSVTLNVTARDANNVASAPVSLTLTVSAAATVTVTTSALPPATNGVAWSTQLAATGGQSPYTFTVTGAPGWLNTPTSGALAGTPNAAGSSNLVITARDANNVASAPVTLPLTVSAPSAIQITWGSPQPPYTYGIGIGGPTMTATGGTAPYTWSATGLPTPCAINATSGQITGAPNVTGNFNVAITATDSTSQSGTSNFLMPVNFALGPSPNAVVGQALNYQMTVAGGTAPYTWVLSGQPSWMSIDPATGIITGTPSATGSGTLTITATDSTGFATSVTNNWAVVSSVEAPARMFRGIIHSTRAVVTWWPSRTQVADSYNVYRNGTLLAQGVRGITFGLAPDNSKALQYYWMDSTLSPSTTYNYYVKSVIGSTESAASETLSITTLQGQVSIANPPNLPVPVADPATWVAPFAIPASGTTWTATNTTDTNGFTGHAGTLGATGKLSVNCSLQYAFTNARPGDVIVLSAGNVHRATSVAGTGFRIPATINGANNDWVYVISSETPEYKSGGTLPARVDTPVDKRLTPLNLTGTLAVGATTATLTSAWTGRTMRIPTMMFGTSGQFIVEFFPVQFTNGSTNISWLTPLAYPADSVIGVSNHNGLSDTDKAAMPRIQFSRTSGNINQGWGLEIQSGVKNIRFVGIVIEPQPDNTMAAGVPWPNYGCIFWNISTWGSKAGGTNVVQPADHVYFDRCLIGPTAVGEAAWDSFGHVRNGGGTSNCDHLYVSQCWLAAWSAEGTDNYCWGTAGGGPICIRNSYLEACSENYLLAGIFVAESLIPHDVTFEGNVACKNTVWYRNAWNNPTGNTHYDGWTASPGHKFKNHLEPKMGVRIRAHGNVHVNCHMTLSGGSQHGRSFVNGMRGGTYEFMNLNSGAGELFAGCPWEQISDMDIYDNLIFGVGQGIYCFGYDESGYASAFCERIHFHNNMVFINPGRTMINGQAIQTQANAVYLAAGVTDLYINKNTFIYNPACPNYNNGRFEYTTTLNTFSNQPWRDGWTMMPGAAGPQAERFMFVDNICDGYYMAGKDGIATTGPAALAIFTNSLFNYNLTIRDNANYQSAGGNMGTTWFKNVGYANVGFANFTVVNSGVTTSNPTGLAVYRPPVPVTDWNITSGTYLTAASDGGPLGAHF